jgi:hypothetical protein
MNDKNVIAKNSTPAPSIAENFSQANLVSSQLQLINIRVLSACNGVIYPITLHPNELS